MLGKWDPPERTRDEYAMKDRYGVSPVEQKPIDYAELTDADIPSVFKRPALNTGDFLGFKADGRGVPVFEVEFAKKVGVEKIRNRFATVLGEIHKSYLDNPDDGVIRIFGKRFHAAPRSQGAEDIPIAVADLFPASTTLAPRADGFHGGTVMSNIRLVSNDSKISQTEPEPSDLGIDELEAILVLKNLSVATEWRHHVGWGILFKGTIIQDESGKSFFPALVHLQDGWQPYLVDTTKDTSGYTRAVIW